ncbi:MAG: YbaB/EbfC family nucleoid-associated protein [Spirochaetes bacterium]|uniref:Nucleoid-associated protein IAA97_09590 n=1 Tax=Candidatus Ornithospirochaeta stercoripullorum TaxID=2840899 RepID=A0A9D9E116_9SPIO|nr:YbaB/EbfC family nucleoid-associated protein [Candidatus Ornithospirochaeta stercoripullorum]
MFPNMNPFELMKTMGSIQSQMKTIKEELSKITATGSAGAGLVEATVNGEFMVQKITISDSAMAMNDKGAIEVLTASAINDAINKVKEKTEERSRELLQEIQRKN